jgi:Transcription factor Tfb4
MSDVLDDRNPSILVVIVEANPFAMKLLLQQPIGDSVIDGNDFIGILSLVCHSYSLMNRLNRIAVIANHISEATVLYPRRCKRDSNGGLANDDYIPVSHVLQSTVSHGLREYLAQEPVGLTECDAISSLAQALSMALCGEKVVDNKQSLYYPCR